MDQTLKLYFDEAQKGRTNKSFKNMERVRKFIHKNQNYDFTEKEKGKLFSIVEAYFTMYNRAKDEKPLEEGKEKISSFPLIEDCLKVPCFTTKQKNAMLKWYYEIQGKDSNNGGSGSGGGKVVEKVKPKNKYYSDDEEEEVFDDEDKA